MPETKAGLRDRALILTLALTGRRRSEVLSLTRRDLSEEGSDRYYAYRGKGGKKGKRELPAVALAVIEAALQAYNLNSKANSVWLNEIEQALNTIIKQQRRR